MVRACGWWMAGLLVLSGCKPDTTAKRAEDIDRGATAPAERQQVAADPATLGSVTGEVTFAGKAPAPVKIDMTMDPVCEMKAGDNYSEQYAVKDGRLGNVFVYVKSGPGMLTGAAGKRPAPVILDQKGCRYTPHVIGVMAGDTVEFRNSDPTMHNIHTMPTVVGNDVVDVSQGPNGEPQRRVFKQPELMLPVRCNNHPWMNAFINVSATPFFEVTGADGTFTLTGLPAGEYTLGAVQEKMGEQTVTVTVKANEATRTNFKFAMK